MHSPRAAHRLLQGPLPTVWTRVWTLGQFLVLSFYTHCRVNTLGQSGSAGGFLEGEQWAGAPPPRWPPTPPTDTTRVCGQVFPDPPRMGRKISHFTRPKPEKALCRRWCPASCASACPLSYKGPVRPPAHLSERRRREKGDLDSLLSVPPMFSLLCLSFKRMFPSLTEVLSCLHNPPVSSGLAPLRAGTSWKRGSLPHRCRLAIIPRTGNPPRNEDITTLC